MAMNRMKRRQFLKRVAAAGVATALGRTAYAQVASAPSTFNDYKALVCVFLFGGNDSYNMVVPRSTSEHRVYAQSRQSLAVDLASLLPITPARPDPGGVQLGLHPAIPELAGLFEDEACAIVSNVGPLIRPTTREEYLQGTASVPPQLFSHFDQQNQWQSLRGGMDLRTGWAGRIADALIEEGSVPADTRLLPLNLSLAGQVLQQTGSASRPYTIGANGPEVLAGLAGSDPDSAARRAAFERLLRAGSSNIYERAFVEVQERTLRFAEQLEAALGSVRSTQHPPFQSRFPDSPLGIQLKTVAQLIAARDRLDVSRQIFFVATDGFDTHDHQLRDQPPLFENLSRCLAAFYRATFEMGIAASVTTFTQSDFARTLTSNGDGTDHAWGGVQLVVGGAVRGRNVYGTYPLLQIDGADDVGGGRLSPSTSSDQYVATLAAWFGVPASRLTFIAPNLKNFTTRDLGFMG
jgi:uncharacterized protein (DUF1501 family)